VFLFFTREIDDFVRGKNDGKNSDNDNMDKVYAAAFLTKERPHWRTG